LAWEVLTLKSPLDAAPRRVSDGSIDLPEFVNRLRSGLRPDISILSSEYCRNFLERCWVSDPDSRPAMPIVLRELSDIRIVPSSSVLSDIPVASGSSFNDQMSMMSPIDSFTIHSAQKEFTPTLNSSFLGYIT